MTSFLIALAVLVGGYFIYGTLIDRLIGTTETGRCRPTGCATT